MEDTHRKQIKEYLRKNIAKGYPQDTLKFALINQGYSRIIVEACLEEINQEFAKDAPILKEKPEIRYEIVDENDNPIEIKKSWWKRIFD